MQILASFQMQQNKSLLRKHILVRSITIKQLMQSCFVKQIMIKPELQRFTEDVSLIRNQIYQEVSVSLFFHQRVKNMFLSKNKFSHHENRPIVLHEEYVATLQYLFRYDRGVFWAIEILQTIFPPSKILFKFPLLINLLTSLLKITTIKRIGFSISEKTGEFLSVIPRCQRFN